MSSFKIYQDNNAGTTTVSNLFIDQYMKDANDAQLKIYLYLLRMMSAHLATSISDIADKFNHTEKDILRSLKYWEKINLLSLEYDESKHLVGVRLLEVRTDADSDVDSNTDLSIIEEETVCATPPPQTVTLAPVVPLPPKPDPYEKPSYSLDQMKEFKNNEDTSQILFVAEQYLGKALTPNEIRTILFFVDKLSFSVDLVDYLIQYCVEKGKKDFRYIEKVAITWAEEGITTPRQAAKSTHKYDKTVYGIMKSLGKSSSPTPAEVAFTTKWLKEFGFTLDIITEACERTVMATDKHRFEYTDSILTNWHRKNVHHLTDVRALDESFTKSKPTTVKTNSSVAAKRFNQFPQNNYDFDALEQEILSN